MDERSKLAYLSSMSAAQREAMDDQVLAERRHAVASVRHRVAIATTIPVWMVGIGVFGYGMTAQAVELGISGGVLFTLIGRSLVIGFSVLIMVGMVSMGVYNFANWIMGD